jgi:hypothetical protein
MPRLQNSVLYLLILLTFLFNIERLDVAGAQVINLATGVYVLSATAVFLTIIVKWIRSLPQPVFVLCWIAVFFLTKVALISKRPLLGGIYTYLTFTELSLFIAVVLLAYSLARNLGDVERSINSFAFANFPRIKRVEDAQEEIQEEIYRSRRFQRHLSIVVLEREWKGVPNKNNTAVHDTERVLTEGFLFSRMVRDILTQLRQTDLLLEHNKKSRLIIVSPETDHVGIENLIERLRPLAQSETISSNFSAATFPEDGLTFEQLLEHAELELPRRTASRISLSSPEMIEKN